MAYDDIVLKGYVYNDAGTGVSGATVKVYAGDSADTSTSGSALDDIVYAPEVIVCSGS